MARGPTQAAWFSNQKMWNKSVRWSFLQKLKSARFPSGTTGLVTITHSVFKWAATSHPALSLISKKPPPFNRFQYCYRIGIYLLAWAAMKDTKISNKNQNNYLKTADFLSAVELPLIQTKVIAILKYPKTTNTKKNYYLSISSDIDYLIDSSANHSY